jgi:phospholipid transport system substrate-binding protein
MSVRHSSVFALFLFLITTAGLAGWVAPASASAKDAEALVRHTTDAVLARLEKERPKLEKHPEGIYDLVEDLVLPHFDFWRMSQWVLGRYWRRADDQQRAAFVDQFRTLLVRTYATALLQYTGQNIQYLPLRASTDASDVTVRTEIAQPSGQPVRLDYSMHRDRNGDWKVYDITVEGVSLVTNYRSTFSGEIRQHGLDQLIQNLKKRNEEATAHG